MPSLHQTICEADRDLPLYFHNVHENSLFYTSLTRLKILCLILFDKDILNYYFFHEKNCLHWKRSSSVDINILNKFLVLKINFSEKLAPLNNYLFTRNCCSCSEKLATLNNYLFTRICWSIDVSPKKTAGPRK